MRWLAWAVIDNIVAAALAFVVALIIAGTYHAASDSVTEDEQDSLIGGLTLLGTLILFVYFWVANSIGRSVGKVALGLRTVTVDEGTPPGWARGLLRTIGYGLSTVPLGLGFLWAAWDKHGQAWHDKMAGTIVVRTGRDEPGSGP